MVFVFAAVAIAAASAVDDERAGGPLNTELDRARRRGFISHGKNWRNIMSVCLSV